MKREKAEILCHAAYCDTGLGEHMTALENYEHALSIYRSIYGSNHNKYSAIVIGKISQVYYNMEEHMKAKECLRLCT